MAHWIKDRFAEARKLRRDCEVAALNDTGDDIMVRAKQEVPLDEGAMRDSGKVERSRAKMPSVRLKFGGGPDEIPARRLHESRILKIRHGRKRRFLADPFNALALPKYRQHLREQWKRRLG